MSKTKTKYISASQIGTFLTCPLAYKYIYVDGAKRMPPNPYTVFGSAIHSALEYNFEQKIKSKTDLDTMSIINKFQTEFENGLKTVSRQWMRYSSTLNLQGEDMISKYMADIAPDIIPIATEQKFEIELKSIGVTILGYIDLITEDGTIYDYKTLGESSYRKWTQEYLDNNIQFTLYALAYRKLMDKPEQRLGVQLLKRLKGGPSFDIMYTQRDEQNIIAIVQLLARMDQIIKNDLWYPNLLSCTACDFKTSCNRQCFFK